MTYSPARLVEKLQTAAAPDGLWRIQLHGRGECLIEQGIAFPAVAVLVSGLVKLSYVTPAGDEWIKSFVESPGLFGPAAPAEPSRFAATTLEECRVAILPFGWLAERMHADDGLAAEVAAFKEWLIVRKQTREEMLLCLSAEDRYRRFLADAPALAPRLSQGDIARYLRVTPIAFSRIKRRVRAAGRLDAAFSRK